MVNELSFTNVRVILDRLLKNPLLQDLTLESVIQYTLDFLQYNVFICCNKVCPSTPKSYSAVFPHRPISGYNKLIAVLICIFVVPFVNDAINAIALYSPKAGFTVTSTLNRSAISCAWTSSMTSAVLRSLVSLILIPLFRLSCSRFFRTHRIHLAELLE